ncbi:50S ribosomal protein L13 [Anaerolineae bacterium CFX9]|jgi:large subunit ribosomal protein L13|nr:50S ribosomal protein L13 [Anaerolineae bacterium CFX9]
MAIVKTYTPKPQDIEQKWWIVDAEGQILGRLASKIAMILRGKHKTMWTPNIDVGDYVIVINADKIAVTGNRLDDKVYYRHSKYQGGLRSITLRQQLEKHPDRPIYDAVKGMLPKNALGRAQLKKLKVYAGAEHPHAAQRPEKLEL